LINFVVFSQMMVFVRAVRFTCYRSSPVALPCSASMPNQLNNYLRAQRRRAGLTQREVAFLLGLKARGPVSELEKRHRVPLLRTALALEIIFGVSAGELFAGMRESIASEMQARLETLSSELVPKVANKRYAYQTRRKLAWLAERRASAVLDEPQPQASARA
jgi:transcriptional regulator with XRE-family HTH domain